MPTECYMTTEGTTRDDYVIFLTITDEITDICTVNLVGLHKLKHQNISLHTMVPKYVTRPVKINHVNTKYTELYFC